LLGVRLFVGRLAIISYQLEKVTDGEQCLADLDWVFMGWRLVSD
jgi:hypothetical protein